MLATIQKHIGKIWLPRQVKTNIFLIIKFNVNHKRYHDSNFRRSSFAQANTQR